MKGLKDKVVVITGGANGIGRETAIKFWNEGSKLVLVDMPSLEETELQHQFPERMTYIQGDITTTDCLKQIDQATANGVDVLINNAGITRDASFLKMSEEQWDSVINVNLTSLFKISQLLATKMKAQNSGVILNAASVVAHYGNFGQANYVATKSTVIGMTKTMAKELGRYNIRVNAIAPGFIGTAMVRNMPEKVIKMMEEKAPLQKIGEPSDIAAGYAFLASDDAKFITGTCLNIDGGLVNG
ncbi:SDR family oxidoreductase [Bacteriovoracaceae bacterium]|nr:SDR family oxidoreductase [Bacteriovoracaceae bacterium]